MVVERPRAVSVKFLHGHMLKSGLARHAQVMLELDVELSHKL